MAVITWGATGLLARNSTWYTYDPQGNVAQRLDATGTVQSTDQYDAWGNRLSGGSANDPYGYRAQYGYYTDAETGLLLCTFRYYNPTLGRCLTRDPIEYRDGRNLYSYVKNNAVNNIDPSGLYSQYQRFFLNCYYTISIAPKIPFSWSATLGFISAIPYLVSRESICHNVTRAGIVTIITKMPQWAVLISTISRYVAVAAVGWEAGSMSTCAFPYYQDYWCSNGPY